MDREQHNRIVIDLEIQVLLDNWHICPFSDNVDRLFDSLKYVTLSYLTHGPLCTKYIVSAVKDLRSYLNCQLNKNLHYFTDSICDAILFKFKNMSSEQSKYFEEYLYACVMYVYSKP